MRATEKVLRPTVFVGVVVLAFLIGGVLLAPILAWIAAPPLPDFDAAMERSNRAALAVELLRGERASLRVELAAARSKHEACAGLEERAGGWQRYRRGCETVCTGNALCVSTCAVKDLP